MEYIFVQNKAMQALEGQGRRNSGRIGCSASFFEGQNDLSEKIAAGNRNAKNLFECCSCLSGELLLKIFLW